MPSDAYYLYDEQTILNQLSLLKKHFPQVTLLYSVKTNPHKEILRSLFAHGCGADAASAAEVCLAQTHGAKIISYSAPGKTETDIRETWGCRIVADSLRELALLEKIAAEKNQTAEISLRINPGPSPSKFGIDADELFAQKNFTGAYPHLNITGIHVHLKSQILDWKELSPYYETVFSLAAKMFAAGLDIRIINFGSGIGVPYGDEAPLNLEALGQKFAELNAKYNTFGAALFFEPGRFLVCRAGTYYTKVLDKKTSHGTTYLIVAGGLNGFLRPGMAHLAASYGAISHPAEPLVTNNFPCAFAIHNGSDEMERVTIAGSLCSAWDVFAEDICLPKADTGDWIEINNAGAYGCTLSLREFAGARKAEERFRKVSGEII
ncbi:MAG TPA: alanine racemase [Methanocorpusculum sp.]|nr:alanine racemase [Methanocorpusculum sp.]